MNEKSYWQRIRKQQLSRRRLLRAGGRAGLGAAGLALIGCGDDDDRQQAAAEQGQQQQQQQAMAQQQDQQQQSMAQQQQDQAQQRQAQQDQQQTAAAAPADDARRGGVLRIGSDIGLSTYRAPYLSSSTHIPLYIPFWDTLTKYSPDGLDPQPHLVESWELNDDQTMLQVKLRPGLEFHNGKPLNATEVKRSLEAMDDEGVGNNQVKGIMTKYVSSVDVIDEVTLQLHLAWGGTLVYDVLNYAQIHDVDDIPNLDGYSSLNGSGPFKFDPASYQVDQYARGDRFENHYEPLALDAIEWHTFQDAEAMTLALSGGELDMAYDVPKSWYARLVEDDDINVELAPPTSLLWMMGMVGTGRGGGHEAIDDPKVRQALYRVIDRQRITAEIFEGLSEPKNVIWPSFSPGYDESLDRDYFDVDEAAELIGEAGYADGTPTLKIACIGFQQEALQMAQIIQQDAALAGINVEPEAMEFSTWLDNFLAGTHDALYIALFSFLAMHPQTLPVMNYQMRIPNSCAYDSPEYQAMIKGWPTADSEAKRQALLDEFNRILEQEPWIAPICTTATLWAAHSNVKGFWDDVTGRPRLMDVYLDDA